MLLRWFAGIHCQQTVVDSTYSSEVYHISASLQSGPPDIYLHFRELPIDLGLLLKLML